jgi:hypothetical protein
MESSKEARKIANCRRAAVWPESPEKLLWMHIQSGRFALSEETVFALSSIWDQLNANKLRKILGSLSDHIHAYVDVSFDDTGYSGVGGVLFDCDGTSIGLLQ